MSDNNKKDTENEKLHISKSVFQNIKEDAKKQKRSITKQIEYIIEKYYELKND